jgi:hypothetical protein
MKPDSVFEEVGLSCNTICQFPEKGSPDDAVSPFPPPPQAVSITRHTSKTEASILISSDFFSLVSKRTSEAEVTFAENTKARWLRNCCEKMNFL